MSESNINLQGTTVKHCFLASNFETLIFLFLWLLSYLYNTKFLYTHNGCNCWLRFLVMLSEERLWPTFTSMISVMSPGWDISRSSSSTLISSFIILIAVDIWGRSLDFSCTHSKPTFRNLMASFSETSPCNIGSNRFISSLELYIPQACLDPQIFCNSNTF